MIIRQSAEMQEMLKDILQKQKVNTIHISRCL